MRVVVWLCNGDVVTAVLCLRLCCWDIDDDGYDGDCNGWERGGVERCMYVRRENGE